MIAEHDLVVLAVDMPQQGLREGDVGTAVLVHSSAGPYEVEFVDASGRTVALLTLAADQVRARRDRELLHVREVTA
ncbi:MAG: DUF4926 domain-containing protein [Planctomycetota bacterium]